MTWYDDIIIMVLCVKCQHLNSTIMWCLHLLLDFKQGISKWLFLGCWEMRPFVVHLVHRGHMCNFYAESRIEFKLSSWLCNHQHKIQEQHLHCRIGRKRWEFVSKVWSGIHTLRKHAQRSYSALVPKRFLCHAWFMKTSKAGSSPGSQTTCLSNLGSNPRLLATHDISISLPCWCLYVHLS